MPVINWEDPAAAGKALRGNWRGFDNFAWHDHPADRPGQWIHVTTHTRDSGLLERSNAAQYDKALEPFVLSGNPTIRRLHSAHWAVGWTEGYAFLPLVGELAEATDPWRAYCALRAREADYPVLDEMDYSQRCVDALLDYINDHCAGAVRRDAPEDWREQMFTALSEQGYDAGANCYPDYGDLDALLTELGFVEQEDDA